MKPLKPLKVDRPNVIPKATLTDEQLRKTSATTLAGSGEDYVMGQRGHAKELLARSRAGQGSQNPNVTHSQKLELMREVERQRVEELKVRKSQDEKVYQFDIAGVETFNLPGRPAIGAVLDKRRPLTTKIRAMKTSQEEPINGFGVTSKQPAGTVNEFAFLSSALHIPTTIDIDAMLDGSLEEKNNFDFNEEGSITLGKDNSIAPPGSATAAQNAVELDEIAVIMKDIHTGDDAIKFFARFGSETPLKFVNLVQRNDPKVFRPYDLVAAEIMDPKTTEYFVMSPVGIVHMAPGESSECMPLSTWTRQSMFYNILRNIPYYKLFLRRKMFNGWRDNVRFLQFVRQRKQVSEKLFFTRKNSSKPILAVKRHLMTVQNVKLLQLDLKTSDKDVFVEMQTQQCNKAAAVFEDAMRLIITQVQAVINDTTAVFNQANKDPASSAVGYADGNVEKMKSLVAMKEERANQKLLKQKAKVEYKALVEFIRLCDYLAVETFVELALNTINAFYDEFVKSRKTGIFETYVRFTETSTMFSPTCQEIKMAIDTLLETVVGAIANVNRVSYLNVKSSGKIIIGPNIPSLIRESRRFRLAADNFTQRILADFDKASEFTSSYDTVRPIYDFNQTWDFAAFRAQNNDISTMKAMMETFNDWGKELEKLRNKPIGVLEVDSKRIKSELNPLREARMQEIKEYIKEVARIKCVKMLDHYKECLAKLANRPGSLKEFTQQINIVNSLREEEKNTFKATTQIDQMYLLLQNFEVAIPSEDMVLHEDMHDKQQDYRREMDSALGYKESKLDEMVTAVDVSIIKLLEQVSAVQSRLEDNIFLDGEFFSDSSKPLEELQQLLQKFEAVENSASTYSSYQQMFGVPQLDQTNIVAVSEKLKGMKVMWDTIKLWNDKYEYWLESPFTALSVEDVDKEVQVLFKDSYNLHKKLGTKVSEMLKDKVSEFKAIMPNVLDLGNPNMRARHWDKLFRYLHQVYVADMPFTLSFLLEKGVMNFKDQIGEVSASASGEAQLEASLLKISAGWEKQVFTVMNHREQHNLFILGSLEEIFVLLEDNQVTLQTMLGSRFIKDIQDAVEEWAKKLATLSETLDEWVACQRTWMYLENIFGAEDIQKQLPAESQKFLVVDRSWKAIMNRTNVDPHVLLTLQPLDPASETPLLTTFVLNNAALESIQKSLEEYLETKRMAFPRFYFLSNDELLEIMSQTRDPKAVQPHMSKCFDAIKRIKFGDNIRTEKDIFGFLDPSGEYVALSDSVRAEGPVESWLLSFEKGMRKTLYDMCKHAHVNYPPTPEGAIDRKAWMWGYPAQVVIAVDQVLWTANGQAALLQMEGTHEGIEADPLAMTKFLNFSLKQIDAMVDLVRQPLDKLQRCLLGAMLTIDVHARDVVRALVAKNVSSLSDFEWTKQLRYYWEEKEDDIYAKQTNSSFRYGYEYLGNGPRLVITPLTDTCYMTLTGALHMKLGGAPAGPAGTGKTETTKDLAKALAVYWYADTLHIDTS